MFPFRGLEINCSALFAKACNDKVPTAPAAIVLRACFRVSFISSALRCQDAPMGLHNPWVSYPYPISRYRGHFSNFTTDDHSEYETNLIEDTTLYAMAHIRLIPLFGIDGLWHGNSQLSILRNKLCRKFLE